MTYLLSSTVRPYRGCVGRASWRYSFENCSISAAVTVTGCRRARYRGLRKTHLAHVYSAVALNLHRLDAYWNDTPIDRGRTSHLARLDLSLRLAA